jgi:hypothetical protein
LGEELPISSAHEKFDAHGPLVDPLVSERLRQHLSVLVDETSPQSIAA